MDQTGESRFINIKHKLSYVFDYLIHFIIFTVLCYIIWITINYYRYLLSWHAILGTIAVILLMSEGLILFSNDFITKYQGWFHGTLFILATVFFVLSTSLEYHNKSIRSGHRHFHTVHGVTGLMATFLAILTCILGVSTSKHELFRKHILETRLVALKILHIFFGLFVYILSVLCLCFAYYSNWLQGIISSFARIFLVIVTLIIAGWTIKHAFKTFVNLIKGEFSI